MCRRELLQGMYVPVLDAIAWRPNGKSKKRERTQLKNSSLSRSYENDIYWTNALSYDESHFHYLILFPEFIPRKYLVIYSSKRLKIVKKKKKILYDITF